MMNAMDRAVIRTEQLSKTYPNGVRAVDAQQAGLLGGVERLDPGAELGRRPQDRGGSADLVGGGDEQQRLRRLGQRAHALQERVLDPRADRQRLDRAGELWDAGT